MLPKSVYFGKYDHERKLTFYTKSNSLDLPKILKTKLTIQKKIPLLKVAKYQSIKLDDQLIRATHGLQLVTSTNAKYNRPSHTDPKNGLYFIYISTRKP